MYGLVTIQMITWCARVICCYCLSQSRIVAPHRVFHSLHQSSPSWFPEPLHLVKGGETSTKSYAYVITYIHKVATPTQQD